MSRPVFVPKSKRRQKKPYFHGAFTGGFSAGYYNTVGSKEGWTPRENEEEQQEAVSSQEPKRQRMEDFMDEQDHNEWGGPTNVKKEYAESTRRQASSVLERVVAEPPQNVGRRLLRVLGWRDGSTAYVPLDEQHADGDETAGATTEEQSLLTAKKLKRIRLQQSRVKIPAPKLDVCGLGFSPHANAPEFQRHLEKRKRMARERARAATGSGGGRNVYRTSHLLDGNDDDDDIDTRGQENDDDDHNVSYETVQDFVGSKTVGGFALREDDDDVYDDHPATQKSGEQLKVDDNEYDTVIYDHDSDDDQGDSNQGSSGQQDFGGVLSSWASLHGTTSASTATVNQGVTSDGRPPLAGFVLGTSDTVKAHGGTDSTTQGEDQTVRFAGPDVPINYTVKRHDFGQEEHPEMLGEVSRSIQRELLMERKHAAEVQSLLPKHPVKDDTKSQKPMAGTTAFAGLGAAMKNRFTSADKSSSTKENSAVHPVGLHIPQPSTDSGLAAKEEPPKNESASQQQKEAVSITRTVFTFVPESLLCKRFHIRKPAITSISSVASAEGGESSYFRDEILKPAAAERAKKVSKDAKNNSGTEIEPVDGTAAAPVPDPVDRPSMKVFKSIFEPESASSESEDDSVTEHGESQTEIATTSAETSGTNGARIEGTGTVPPDSSSAFNVPKEVPENQTETTTAPTPHPLLPDAVPEARVKPEERDRQKRRRGEESSTRRRRYRRDSVEDSSSSSESLDSRKRRKRKKERKRRDEKKRRHKKHKSTKRS